MKAHCKKQNIKSLKFKSVISLFIGLFLLINFSINIFAEEIAPQNDAGVNIKAEDLIFSMDTDIISAAGDIFCVVTVDGKVKVFFKDYYTQLSSDFSDEITSQEDDNNKKTSTNTQQSSIDENVSEEKEDFSQALKKSGIIKFNSFADYKDKALALKSINQIKDEINIFDRIIGVKNSPGSIITLNNNNEIVHFDFTSGYLEDNSPYTFNPKVSGGKTPLNIVTADNYFAVLFEDGTVSTIVSNNSGFSKELEETSKWSDIKKIVAGENHIIGLKNDGSVVAAGINNYGQKDVGIYSSVANVAASSNHTVVLFSNGTVKATGNNSNGQCDVSGFSNIVAIDTSDTGTVGLKCNGTVVYAGAGEQIKKDVAFWENIVAVKAGRNFVIGVTDEGKIVVSQQDIENPLIIDENTAVNINQAKSLREARIKIKTAFDQSSSNLQTRLEQEKTAEQNKQIRHIVAYILIGIFIIVVIIYSFVLKTKNKRI